MKYICLAYQNPQIGNRTTVFSINKNNQNTGFAISGGPTPGEGNVFYNGLPICDDGWDDRDAKVFCKMMGYQGGRSTMRSTYGSVSPDFSMRPLFSICQNKCPIWKFLTPPYFRDMCYFRKVGIHCVIIKCTFIKKIMGLAPILNSF